MAKTSYIDILPEIEEQFFSNINPVNRFQYSRVGRKNVLLSLKTKKGLSQRSLLPEVASVWATLTTIQKAAWTSAGAQCNLNGYRLFTQDYCARKVNGLSGPAMPSLLHQSWIGQLQVAAPASEAKIIQVHPSSYYIKQKVYGKKSMYNPVLISEPFTLPLVLSINYKSNLTTAGPNPFAKFYAHIWYSYQGQNLFHDLEIPLDLIADWKNATATLSSLLSIVIGYSLYIHLHDLQGDLYFDNIKATHGAVNWVRDPFCQDVNQGFTLNYYQVPKHWAAEIFPAGCVLESVYKDF